MIRLDVFACDTDCPVRLRSWSGADYANVFETGYWRRHGRRLCEAGSPACCLVDVLLSGALLCGGHGPPTATDPFHGHAVAILGTASKCRCRCDGCFATACVAHRFGDRVVRGRTELRCRGRNGVAEGPAIGATTTIANDRAVGCTGTLRWRRGVWCGWSGRRNWRVSSEERGPKESEHSGYPMKFFNHGTSMPDLGPKRLFFGASQAWSLGRPGDSSRSRRLGR